MLRALMQRLTGSPAVAVPDTLWEATLAQLTFTHRLDAGARARLRELVGRFLADKQMAGAGGLELDAAMQVNIAVQACLPVLELGLEWYRGWTSIVVYPGEFLVPRSVVDDDGVTHEYTDSIAGEAWDGGPLLLSWEDAQRHRGDDGLPYALVVHEFAHKLDLLAGDADGLPPLSAALHARLSPARWRATLDDAYERFCAELELIADSLPAGMDPDSAAADPWFAGLPLDAYAAHDAGEFFAVSSEAFFVDPRRLEQAFPQWYALLAQFYRQDPLAAGGAGA